MIVKYVLLFIFFGILGWVIDSVYRSLFEEHRWHSGTRFLFFSPIYAIGGMLLVLVYTFLPTLALQIIVGAVLLILLELFSGIFCEKVMKKRYWDYSNSRWNYKGHIDALHAFYWVILSALFMFVVPYVTINI